MFFNLLTKVYCFLDRICGDKCIRNDKNCECGDIFDRDAFKYCCIQMNETCKTQGIYSNIDYKPLR